MTTEADNNPQNQTLPTYSLDLIPETYRKDPIFKDFKTWDDVFKSHKHAAELVGVDKNQVFRIPKDGNMSEVYKALGKPEKFEFLPDVKNPNAFSEKFKQGFLKEADGLNLTAKQFEGVLRFMDEQVGVDAADKTLQSSAERAAKEAALKTELGEAYNQNINLAKDALETFEAKDLWDEFDKAGLTTNSKLIGFLAEIAKLSGEDGLITGEGHSTYALTPNQAGAEINTLLLDTEFKKAYLDKSHPSHKAAVDKIWNLRQKEYPR